MHEHKVQLQPEWQTGTSLQIHNLTGCHEGTANTKKSFPYIWNFSPKINLPELKDLEKFPTAELKRFCSLTCKSLNYCEYFLSENGNATISEKKELIPLQRSQDFTIPISCPKKLFWAFNIASNFCFLIFVFCRRNIRGSRRWRKSYPTYLLCISTSF